jgi:AmmeMemoRadiSam system protein B
MYKEYFNNLRGMIIPHAGYEYAGSARKIILDNLVKKDRDIRFIIYLAALHNPVNTTNKVLVLKNNINFKELINKNYETDNIPEGGLNEHSYKWVENEINYYFNKAEIIVLAPTPYTNIKTFANDIIKFITNTKEKVLLIATTDLIHYGKRFNNLNLLDYPQQLGKWRLEEDLIDDLINNKITDKNAKIICGPYAIKTFIYISNYFKWSARVIDYYDSSDNKSKLIDKYRINYNKRNQEFVSYVSIIYGIFKKNNLLLPLDIIQCLSLVKSTIDCKLNNRNDLLLLPKWNKLYNYTNGIFVGTEINNMTNSCVGQFENLDDKMNSVIKIFSSSQNVLNDAKMRWGAQITKKNLDNLNYKVEILDNIENWKEYLAINVENKFNFNGKEGILLTLYNGKSATFLPVVAKDNLNKWSKYDYMDNLSIKASGNKDDWKNKDSKIKIYKSIVFKYNCINESIEIE